MVEPPCSISPLVRFLSAARATAGRSTPSLSQKVLSSVATTASMTSWGTWSSGMLWRFWVPSTPIWLPAESNTVDRSLRSRRVVTRSEWYFVALVITPTLGMSAARQTPMTTPPTTTVVRKPARGRNRRMGSTPGWHTGPRIWVRGRPNPGRFRCHTPSIASSEMPPDACVRLLLAGHGPPAREALYEQIGALRGDDPLTPVTVAVPSTYAGLSLRRDLGRRPGGLVNVRFLSLNRVAELLGAPFLAAPGRVPLTATHRAGAIRVALDATDGPFRPLATHPATTRAFAATLAELDGLTDAELARVACTGDAGADAWVSEIAERLASALGAARVVGEIAVPTGDHLLSCADADDEARVVVRY